jgi:hypothetical protein
MRFRLLSSSALTAYLRSGLFYGPGHQTLADHVPTSIASNPGTFDWRGNFHGAAHDCPIGHL